MSKKDSKQDIRKDGCNTSSHTHHHRDKLDSQASCISVVPIFNHLEEEQMDEIMKVMKSISYKKGQMVYREGDTSNALYVVSKGKIRIYRLSESGKEQLLRILNPGDFTGELALFRESIHEAYAEAMSNTDVCMISKNDLQEFLLKYPTISLKFLSELSNRLETLEKQTTRFTTEKVDARLALFLAECMDDGEGSMEIELPMNRKDLASYLGTTPETVSRKLADFENEGYIKQKASRKIEILDLDGLLLV
ncbi:Crp/Fnr family transcriptional regulator [Ligilactobacillus animalis]|uniref:Crp/Fnr family transcriptional regulator n=1 Tax=Ligilactobacillus animalis TaxID=1605 RepID=UPI000219433E|nr:Crp/Fnr family transcriptional regulator [Ligilactobacillus animalis]KRM58341.1 Crp family regulatory protein [Ligilactobacillus animalis KCTC 3501 = DSM 20602]MDO5882656.1 Crp/Fnr family transcriptional regulator [Ligilactobacillus animalis]MDU8986885.1 Crp/Fnr family transcriptional regulator [Ligilactobacillus animalis]THE20127.1 Crp/Fnr family transcriptional regulator [Ligilactobacillus animalis]THE21326.1 Crp/Fnr family transcriptional regulator [Ligilactobacillus animalis]